MSEYSIEVENVSKKFKIYHERRDTVFESIVGWFSRKKYYEYLDVLKNISFKVKKGEMLGIIGKNGEGKTTLLRLISNVYEPDEGKIKKDGILIPLRGLGIGFRVELTARDNIIEYGELLGFSKKEIKKKINDIIEFAELEKFADTKLKNFSSGMYMRLAFSTAVQVNPDIILIDESLAVGDMGFQKKSFDKILEFKKQGKTIIFVAHGMDVIEANCDRVIFLKDGRIAAEGEPKKVIDAYIQSVFPDKDKI